MSMVHISGAGGNGIFSSDLSTIKEHVLEGESYVGADTDDDVAVGTMPNIVAIDKADYVVESQDGLSLSMTAGAHITSTNRNHPEVIATKDIVRDAIGMNDANVILEGHTYLGMHGSMPNMTGWNGNITGNDEITIPRGYHDGNGKVVANIGMAYMDAQTGMRAVRQDGNNLIVGITPGAYVRNGVSGFPEIVVPIDVIVRNQNISVASVSNFSTAKVGRQIRVGFTPPSTGFWSGLRVVWKLNSYPTNPGDGTAVDWVLTNNTPDLIPYGNWYFRAWNYWIYNDVRYYGSYVDSWQSGAGYNPCNCDGYVCDDCSCDGYWGGCDESCSWGGCGDSPSGCYKGH
jgi:hypothetical protein